MKTTDPECDVACVNLKCAFCHPKTASCVMKGILIGPNGQCHTFLPKDFQKFGQCEYPLFTHDEMQAQEKVQKENTNEMD